MILVGLLREGSVKFQNIYFILCLNHFSAALEVEDPLVQELKMLEKGIKVFDGFSESNILLFLPHLADC